MGVRRMKTARRGASAKRGTLRVCGLGIDRPHDVTLGTIQALKDSQVAFYIHGDGESLKPFLSSFCPDVRLIGGETNEAPSDEKRLAFVAGAVCAELRKGKNAAYVTYGHPLIFSEGHYVLKHCRAAGFTGRVVTAPSSVDSILAEISDIRDPLMRGYYMGMAETMLRPESGPRKGGAAVLLCLDSVVRQGRFGDFCRRMKAAYPGDHKIFAVKCADSYSQAVRLSGRVDQLASWEKSNVHMMSLIVPEFGGKS